MKIDLRYLSCNRLHYTKLSIAALLADPSEEFTLTIWDNGSTDGSRELLESIKDSRIVKKVLSPTNVNPFSVSNQAIAESSADLIGFVAEDILVTPGWTHGLRKAHEEVPEFGRLSCWHFPVEKFDYERARHKMQTFGQHQILRHPWTNGCGLSKVKAMREIGLIRTGESENAYWTRMALQGYVNGFYYPLIPVDHMDEPWSANFIFAGQFDKWLKQSSAARLNGIRSIEEAEAWHESILDNLLDDPWEAKHYVGWRLKLRRGKSKVRRLLTGSRF